MSLLTDFIETYFPNYIPELSLFFQWGILLPDAVELDPHMQTCIEHAFSSLYSDESAPVFFRGIFLGYLLSHMNNQPDVDGLAVVQRLIVLADCAVDVDAVVPTQYGEDFFLSMFDLSNMILLFCETGNGAYHDAMASNAKLGFSALLSFFCVADVPTKLADLDVFVEAVDAELFPWLADYCQAMRLSLKQNDSIYFVNAAHFVLSQVMEAHCLGASHHALQALVHDAFGRLGNIWVIEEQWVPIRRLFMANYCGQVGERYTVFYNALYDVNTPLPVDDQAMGFIKTLMRQILNEVAHIAWETLRSNSLNYFFNVLLAQRVLLYVTNAPLLEHDFSAFKRVLSAFLAVDVAQMLSVESADCIQSLSETLGGLSLAQLTRLSALLFTQYVQSAECGVDHLIQNVNIVLGLQAGFTCFLLQESSLSPAEHVQCLKSLMDFFNHDDFCTAKVRFGFGFHGWAVLQGHLLDEQIDMRLKIVCNIVLQRCDFMEFFPFVNALSSVLDVLDAQRPVIKESCWHFLAAVNLDVFAEVVVWLAACADRVPTFIALCRAEIELNAFEGQLGLALKVPELEGYTVTVFEGGCDNVLLSLFQRSMVEKKAYLMQWKDAGVAQDESSLSVPAVTQKEKNKEKKKKTGDDSGAKAVLSWGSILVLMSAQQINPEITMFLKDHKSCFYPFVHQAKEVMLDGDALKILLGLCYLARLLPGQDCVLKTDDFNAIPNCPQALLGLTHKKKKKTKYLHAVLPDFLADFRQSHPAVSEQLVEFLSMLKRVRYQPPARPKKSTHSLSMSTDSTPSVYEDDFTQSSTTGSVISDDEQAALAAVVDETTLSTTESSGLSDDEQVMLSSDKVTRFEFNLDAQEFVPVAKPDFSRVGFFVEAGRLKARGLLYDGRRGYIYPCGSAESAILPDDYDPEYVCDVGAVDAFSKSPTSGQGSA